MNGALCPLLRGEYRYNFGRLQMQKTQLAAALAAVLGLAIGGAALAADPAPAADASKTEVKETKTETKTDKTTKKEHHKKAAKGKDASCKGKEGSCKAK
jgi:hypothetical protein